MLAKDIKDPRRHFHQPHENGAYLDKESVEIIWSSIKYQHLT